MKRLFCFFLIVVMAFSLVSCKTDELLKTNSSHLLLHACVCYSVPGFYYSDLKGSGVNIIEVDDYGRTLVSYEGYNWFSDENELAYVICQKYSQSNIYFYEDINYLMSNETFTSLENLKKTNDWNCEIKEDKLSKREIRISLDLCLVKDFPFSNFSNEKFYFSLSNTCGILKEEVYSIDKCDWDGQKQVLYVITLKNHEKYFCIVDTEYIVYTAKIEKKNNYVADIQDLKVKSNWHYGP